MAETGGVLGRLPKWPRKALNNSVIAAEQAYRKRSGLPLLTDADIEALKAGVPDAVGGAAPACCRRRPLAAAAAPVAAAPLRLRPQPLLRQHLQLLVGANQSPKSQQQVAAGKKWSKSSIAAEQARRKRNNLPPLNDAEITALLGEPAAPAAAPAARSRPPSAAPAAAQAAAAAPAKPSAAASVARSGESTTYVGTPAVGTSKAAAAGGIASDRP